MGNKMKYMIRGILTILIIVQVPMLLVMAQTATVKWDANVRKEPSTTSEVVTSVKSSEQLTIEDETDENDGYTWYYVTTSTGKVGYIREDLVTVGGTSQSTSASTSASTLEDDVVQVLSDNTNIRGEASTSGRVVASVSKGVQLYIQSQVAASDGAVWYEVNFTYEGQTVEGYIRSDLVTYDEVEVSNGDPAETEILGSLSGDDEVSEEGTTESLSSQTTPEIDNSFNDQEEYTLVGTDLNPILPYGYKAVQVSWGGEELNGWKKGEFFIFYAIKSDGSRGFVRYDSQEKTYQRYEEEEGYPGGVFANNTTNLAMGILVLSLIIAITIAIMMTIKYHTRQIEQEFAREEEKSARRRANRKQLDEESLSSSEEEIEDEDDYYEDDEYDDEDDYPVAKPREKVQQPAVKPVKKGKNAQIVKPATVLQEKKTKQHKTVEPVKKVRSEQVVEPVKKVRPEQVVEPVKKAKVEQTVESTKKAKPKKTVKKKVIEEQTEEKVKQPIQEKEPEKKQVGMETQMLSELEFIDFDS